MTATGTAPPGPAIRVGWHASHEQIPPRRLLADAVRAEAAGFDEAMCSDHLAPWSTAQGESGFAFAWVGSALAATKGVRFGQFHAPGQRYHPVVSAQAIATLAAMHPGRYPWVALGSGEALNEHVTGEPWPPKPVRQRRLRECVDVMRALLAGDEVSHDGLVTVHRARVWSLPDQPPLLVAGAVSAATAAWAAEWADGLLTVNQPLPTVREVVAAYRDAGGRGDVLVQVHLSWDPDEDVALRTAVQQWRALCVAPELSWDLEQPADFERASSGASAEDVRERVLVTADLARLAGWLHEYVAAGADGLFLHHVGTDQQRFLDACGDRLLAELRGAAAPAGAG